LVDPLLCEWRFRYSLYFIEGVYSDRHFLDMTQVGLPRVIPWALIQQLTFWTLMLQHWNILLLLKTTILRLHTVPWDIPWQLNHMKNHHWGTYHHISPWPNPSHSEPWIFTQSAGLVIYSLADTLELILQWLGPKSTETNHKNEMDINHPIYQCKNPPIHQPLIFSYHTCCTKPFCPGPLPPCQRLHIVQWRDMGTQQQTALHQIFQNSDSKHIG
jgi:hypothetical protein